MFCKVHTVLASGRPLLVASPLGLDVEAYIGEHRPGVCTRQGKGEFPLGLADRPQRADKPHRYSRLLLLLALTPARQQILELSFLYCLTRFWPRVKARTLDTSTSVGQIPAGEPTAMIPAFRSA